jgi:hypothetical protein
MDENPQLKLTWDLFVELRKEILETQKIRAQIIGFKITFLSAAIGLILANQQKMSLWLLFIPALASGLFDFLINAQGIAIRRISTYIQAYLEPQLHNLSGWGHAHPMWHEFVAQEPSYTRLFNHFGNIGLTALVMVGAGFAMFTTLLRWQWVTGCAVMGVILVIQGFAYCWNLERYGRKVVALSKPVVE